MQRVWIPTRALGTNRRGCVVTGQIWLIASSSSCFFFLNNVKRVMRRKKKQKKPVQLRLWPTKSEIAPILRLRKLADPSPAIPVLLSLAMFIIASWYASSTSSWVTTSLILFHFSGWWQEHRWGRTEKKCDQFMFLTTERAYFFP